MRRMGVDDSRLKLHQPCLDNPVDAQLPGHVETLVRDVSIIYTHKAEHFRGLAHFGQARILVGQRMEPASYSRAQKARVHLRPRRYMLGECAAAPEHLIVRVRHHAQHYLAHTVPAMIISRVCSIPTLAIASTVLSIRMVGGPKRGYSGTRKFWKTGSMPARIHFSKVT